MSEYLTTLLHYHFDGNAESRIGNILATIYNRSMNTFIVSRADIVAATSVSYAETSTVLKHYLNKVQIVPNGVDLQTFNPAVKEGNIRVKYGLPEENIIFFAGRFVKYKGLKYLIRSMKYVTTGTLVIAGNGPEENEMKKMVKPEHLYIGKINYYSYELGSNKKHWTKHTGWPRGKGFLRSFCGYVFEKITKR